MKDQETQKNYIDGQFGRLGLLGAHYYTALKLRSCAPESAETNWLNCTPEQVAKIREILKG